MRLALLTAALLTAALLAGLRLALAGTTGFGPISNLSRLTTVDGAFYPYLDDLLTDLDHTLIVSSLQVSPNARQRGETGSCMPGVRSSVTLLEGRVHFNRCKRRVASATGGPSASAMTHTQPT
jgi:hypothetical protein